MPSPRISPDLPFQGLPRLSHPVLWLLGAGQQGVSVLLARAAKSGRELKLHQAAPVMGCETRPLYNEREPGGHYSLNLDRSRSRPPLTTSDMSRHLTPSHAISRHITPSHAISRHLTPSHAISCHFTPYYPFSHRRPLTPLKLGRPYDRWLLETCVESTAVPTAGTPCTHSRRMHNLTVGGKRHKDGWRPPPSLIDTWRGACSLDINSVDEPLMLVPVQLDLSRSLDRRTATLLQQRTWNEPRDSWTMCRHAGRGFPFSRDRDFELPHRGVLDFTYCLGRVDPLPDPLHQVGAHALLCSPSRASSHLFLTPSSHASLPNRSTTDPLHLRPPSPVGVVAGLRPSRPRARRLRHVALAHSRRCRHRDLTLAAKFAASGHPTAHVHHERT